MQQAQFQFGLNQEQLQAVLDLEGMGFDYGRALEAFLTCERNQELAIHFLLEQQADEEAEVATAGSQPVMQPITPVVSDDVSLSLREWEAVRRIEDLGFDQKTSLGAFLQFNKDEEAAANRLLM